MLNVKPVTVPELLRDLKRPRSILSKHGIDIDDAVNGIYLKHMDPNSIQPGAYHRVIHTKIYFENVANRLEIADLIGGKNGVLDELDNIAGNLLFINPTGLFCDF